MITFGETAEAFGASVAQVRADPDQSWRDKAHLHYAEVMLARAGRACASMARRLEIPDAPPTTNDVKDVVDLLWDAMAVLAAGKLHPQQQEHAEALWRLMKTAEPNSDSVTVLAEDLLAHVLGEEKVDHQVHGSGSYRPSADLLGFVQRARAINVDVRPPWKGYDVDALFAAVPPSTEESPS